MVIARTTVYNRAMHKESFLLMVGFLVFVTPFLGIPEAWRAKLLFTLGAGIILAALSCRFSARRRNRRSSDIVHTENEPVTVPEELSK